MIPFFSLDERNLECRRDLREAFEETLDSGQFVRGASVDEFESDFAEYLGTATGTVVGVGNGLDALRIILLALDIGPGDEVVVPGFTFIATWLAVAQTGAVLVPVDVDPDTANVTLEGVLAAVTSRTRAVIVVHLFGRMALTPEDVEAIEEVGIYVVEDAAQAHGATRQEQYAGTLGTAGAFSFYPTKNLGCLGDGGAVVTRDSRLAERVRSLSNYGADPNDKYFHSEIGWNSRLDSLQAAILSRLLPRLDDWNRARRDIAMRYIRSIRDATISIPIIGEDSVGESVWHHFVVRVDNRDSVLDQAKELGLQLERHYPWIPADAPAFFRHDQVTTRFSLDNSRSLAQSVLSLPMYPQLAEDMQQRIVELFEASLQRQPRSDSRLNDTTRVNQTDSNPTSERQAVAWFNE